MKKRSLGVILLLSVVTLGIYMLVWTYKTRQEMVSHLHDEKAVQPFWWIFSPYLLLAGMVILTFLASFTNHGELDKGIGMFIVAAAIVAALGTFVIPFWWFISYFRAVDRVTGENEFGLNYAIWVVSIFVGLPVWMMLVQNSFNKTILRMQQARDQALTNTTPSAPVPPVTPRNPGGL